MKGLFHQNRMIRQILALGSLVLGISPGALAISGDDTFSHQMSEITRQWEVLSHEGVTVTEINGSAASQDSRSPVLVTSPSSTSLDRSLQAIASVGTEGRDNPTISMHFHFYFQGDPIVVNQELYKLEISFQPGDMHSTQSDLRYRLFNEVTGSLSHQLLAQQKAASTSRLVASFSLNQAEDEIRQVMLDDMGGSLSSEDEQYAALATSVAATVAASLIWRLAPTIEKSNSWSDDEKEEALQQLFLSYEGLSWLYKEP